MLGNISSSKGNQTFKFCQLIEYNLRNIFLRKSYTKRGGEAIPRPPSKKAKSLYHSWSKVLWFVFFVWQVEGYLKILKLDHRPLVFTVYKDF